MNEERLIDGDALLIIDVQNDFLPGGRLAIPEGDQVIPVINGYIALFLKHGQRIFATRDWHPPDHGSFDSQGGPWSEHCIAGTAGAEFPSALLLPPTAVIISKGMDRNQASYSGFADTLLAAQLEKAGIKRLFVAGLATDYCVVNTVLEALKLHYPVFLLQDAIRAVNLKPEDGKNAELSMQSQGARLITRDWVS